MYIFNVLLFLFCVSFSVGLSAVKYTVEEIEGRNWFNLNLPLKINNKGNIIGIDILDNQTRGYFYDYLNNKKVYLDSFNNRYAMNVLDFNDSDEIIGYGDVDVYSTKYGRERKTHLVIWKDLKLHDLTPIFGDVYARSNRFLSINNKGQFVGFGFDHSGKLSEKDQHSSFFVDLKAKEKKIFRMKESKKYTKLVSINENGDACGGLFFKNDEVFGLEHIGVKTSGSQACVWNACKNKLIKILSLGGVECFSFATDLNDNLEVIGSSEVLEKGSNGENFWHAFIWKNGNVLDLGVLDSDEDSIASSINNHGEVVGHSGGYIGRSSSSTFHYKAFYWTYKTGMLNLNDMIDKESGWLILSAKGINDVGQIVAFASKHGQRSYIVILNPIK